jgi:hypothetical protein
MPLVEQLDAEFFGRGDRTALLAELRELHHDSL